MKLNFKIIKGSVYSDLGGVILCFIVSVWITNKYNLELWITITVGMIVSFLYFTSFIGRHHYFGYSNTKLIVKNTWNFLIHKEYDLINIKQFEIVNALFLGLALRIHLNNGEQKTYPINISRQKLEEMIKDIEQIKT